MTTGTMRRAASYSRNSSAKQKSINEQAAENRADAEAHGWTVVADLSDPLSASRYATKARENWATLVSLLPKIDVVVLWEPSRGDRSLATWAAFLDDCRAHAVLIHAVTHQRTYDPRNARDYRSLAEDGVDSAYESDKISARTLRGLVGVMAAGRPHGSLAYGFRRIYDERGQLVNERIDADGVVHFPQVANEAEAPVVQDLFASVAGGESVNSICTRLTKAGVPTPRGGRVWTGSTVTGIVRNPGYRPHPADPTRACRTHEGRVIGPAAWAPLVDEATWQAANQVLGANDERVRKQRHNSAPGAVKYLLSGSAAVMAAPCGSLLSGWCTAPGRGATYACRHDKCVSCPMPETDEYVTRLIVARLSKDDARDLWVIDDTAARQAADELARLHAELEEAIKSFESPGGISATVMARKEAAMLPAIEDAERRSRPAGAPLAALKLIEAAKFSKATVRPTWDAFPVLAKREVVAGIFSSLILGPGAPGTPRITRWTLPEERLDIISERVTHVWRTP